MADAKTQPTKVTPQAFVASIEHDKKRADAETLLGLFASVTGFEPVMWAPRSSAMDGITMSMTLAAREIALPRGLAAQAQYLNLYHARLCGFLRDVDMIWQT